MSKANGKNGKSSTWLNDSVALLTQSATKAFNDLQTRAQADIARAEAEAQQAKLERDQALKTVQGLKKELQASKEDVLVHKNALHESELTIQHHLESAALLQRELLQWKDQARNWQEHFLRVEEERCSLSSRLDELVAEQLLHISPISKKLTTSTSYITPVYPSSTSSLSLPSSRSDTGTSQTTNGDLKSVTVESTKVKVNSLLQQPDLAPRSPSKQAKSTTKPAVSNSSRARKAKSKSLPSTSTNVVTTSQPQSHSKPRETTVLRRIQAVVRVKQESDSEEDLVGQDPSPIHNNHDIIPTNGSIGNTNGLNQIRTQSQSQSRSQSSMEDSPEEPPLSPLTPHRTQIAKPKPKSASKPKSPSKRNRRIILDEDDYVPSGVEGEASTRRRERKGGGDLHTDVGASVGTPMAKGMSTDANRRNMREDTSGDANPEFGVEDEDDDELMIGDGDDLSFGVEDPDGGDEGETDAGIGATNDKHNNYDHHRGGGRTDKGAMVVEDSSGAHTPQRNKSSSRRQSTVTRTGGSTNGKKRKLTTGNGVNGRPTVRRKT